MSALRRNE
jgi:hypothetical protein